MQCRVRLWEQLPSKQVRSYVTYYGYVFESYMSIAYKKNFLVYNFLFCLGYFSISIDSIGFAVIGLNFCDYLNFLSEHFL